MLSVIANGETITPVPRPFPLKLIVLMLGSVGSIAAISLESKVEADALPSSLNAWEKLSSLGWVGKVSLPCLTGKKGSGVLVMLWFP